MREPWSYDDDIWVSDNFDCTSYNPFMGVESFDICHVNPYNQMLSLSAYVGDEHLNLTIKADIQEIGRASCRERV